MCGIIGIIAKDHEVACDLYLGLWALQHRGQEGAGMVTSESDHFHAVRKMGTIDVAFGQSLDDFRGKAGIGHVRYATAGGSTIDNIQPIEGEFRGKKFWIGHNGNFVRYEHLREAMVQKGFTFRTTSDTEVLAALIHYSGKVEFETALREALCKISGTYSLVILYDGKVIGVRDPTGNRPLAIGFGDGGVFMLSSESASFRVLRYHLLRDIEPGETVILDGALGNWYTIERVKGEHRKCLFEYVYFLRPDSLSDGRRAQIVREEMGRKLWRESPADADCVVAVPDSGKAAALGYSKESGIQLEEPLLRSHFVGRTFIEPIAAERKHGLRIKLNPIPENIRGKRIVLIDDSIVRATVMKKVIADLREAGVAEIHVRVSSPPYRNPCYYGIDTYRVEDELIAKRYDGDEEKIRREIGADSLRYLSIEGLKASVNGTGTPLGFCDACFTGNYPIPIRDEDMQKSAH